MEKSDRNTPTHTYIYIYMNITNKLNDYMEEKRSESHPQELVSI